MFANIKSNSRFLQLEMMFKVLLVIQLIAICACEAEAVGSGTSRCKFPEPWQGQWFESGLGEISILPREITNKGKCVENKENLFLIENKDIGCMFCLKMDEKHYNVLQYQEGFCDGRDTLDVVCSQLTGGSLSRTLIRVGSTKLVSCPLEGAFHFTYNNNTGGFCRNPTSYAKPCSITSHYQLHFQHCPTAAYTYQRVYDLTCAAVWHDDGQSYMIGRLVGTHLRVKEETFRCFVLGTLVYMSMSADASCRGLLSARDGPVVMEFTKDIFGWPSASCIFPTWLTRSSWRNLQGNRRFVPSDHGDILEQRFVIKTTGYNSVFDSVTGRFVTKSTEHVETVYYCQNLLYVNSSKDDVIITVFATKDCDSNYQCIRFVRRRDGVVDFYTGQIANFKTDSCTNSEVFNDSRVMLLDESLPGAAPSCGFNEKQFEIQTGSTVCFNYLRSGCNNSNFLELTSTCSSRPGFVLKCLVGWREGRKRYVIASDANSASLTANCFSFWKSGSKLKFALDHECNMGTNRILDHTVIYSMDYEAKPCISVGQQDQAKQDNADIADNNNTTDGHSASSLCTPHTSALCSVQEIVADVHRGDGLSQQSRQQAHSSAESTTYTRSYVCITVIVSLQRLFEYCCTDLLRLR